MSPPALKCPAGSSDTGAYQLSWTGSQGASFRLLEGDTVVYEGPATTTTVSGREAGRYIYTVGVRHPEAEALTWSDPCVVQVQPPAMSTALFLFLVGLGVFVATLIVIVRGHRAHKDEDMDTTT